jgi:hypothetical protein
MKKIAPYLAIATVAGVVGCWIYWPTYITQQRVKLVLNDPDSAKFRGIAFNSATRAGCGFVNAKNRMGGYVGETHFVATPDGKVRFEPDADTNGGTTQQRLDVVSKQIAYLEFAQANCPSEPSEEKAK